MLLSNCDLFYITGPQEGLKIWGWGGQYYQMEQRWRFRDLIKYFKKMKKNQRLFEGEGFASIPAKIQRGVLPLPQNSDDPALEHERYSCPSIFVINIGDLIELDLNNCCLVNLYGQQFLSGNRYQEIPECQNYLSMQVSTLHKRQSQLLF